MACRPLMPLSVLLPAVLAVALWGLARDAHEATGASPPAADPPAALADGRVLTDVPKAPAAPPAARPDSRRPPRPA